jgi:hypothetical protein
VFQPFVPRAQPQQQRQQTKSVEQEVADLWKEEVEQTGGLEGSELEEEQQRKVCQKKCNYLKEKKKKIFFFETNRKRKEKKKNGNDKWQSRKEEMSLQMQTTIR